MSDTLFENAKIEIHDLPVVDEVSHQPLESSFLTVLMIGRIIVFVILIGAYITLDLFDKIPFENFIGYYILMGIVVLAIISFITGYLGFRKKAYALRQKDILYKTGLIIRNHIAIPFNRIQHCEVQQGAIDRMFNLAKLKIYTAGGSSSDLSIPGLQKHTADRLKEYVLQKITSEHDEEE